MSPTIMIAGWNFERRRDTCARFLIGVSMLAKGVPARETSLEKVRFEPVPIEA